MATSAHCTNWFHICHFTNRNCSLCWTPGWKCIIKVCIAQLLTLNISHKSQRASPLNKTIQINTSSERSSTMISKSIQFCEAINLRMVSFVTNFDERRTIWNRFPQTNYSMRIWRIPVESKGIQLLRYRWNKHNIMLEICKYSMESEYKAVYTLLDANYC